MTFDEMEVGRWYWGLDHDGKWHRFECRRCWDLEKILRDPDTAVYYSEGTVTDITPVPSQETFDTMVAALEEADTVLCLSGVGDDYGIRNQIRAALAQAKGEP